MAKAFATIALLLAGIAFALAQMEFQGTLVGSETLGGNGASVDSGGISSAVTTAAASGQQQQEETPFRTGGDSASEAASGGPGGSLQGGNSEASITGRQGVSAASGLSIDFSKKRGEDSLASSVAVTVWNILIALLVMAGLLVFVIFFFRPQAASRCGAIFNSLRYFAKKGTHQTDTSDQLSGLMMKGKALISVVLLICLLGYSDGAHSGDLDTYLTKLVNNEAIQHFVDYPCDACEAAVVVLDVLLNGNHTDMDILYFFSNVCTIAKIELAEVCHGLVINEFGPEVLYIIRKLGYTPTNLCSIIGVCNTTGAKEVLRREHTDRPRKRVTQPTATSTLQYNPAHQYWVQFTDMHVDPLYKPGANADCGMPTCCRTIDPNSTSIAGYWGDYSCDTTVRMVEAMFNWIANSLPVPVDLILWTGDNPGHDIWEQSMDENLSATRLLIALLSSTFPKTPIYPTLGNHESYPVDQYHTPEKSWLTNAMAEYWGPDGAGWIDANAAASVRMAGYYTTILPAGPNATAPLRLISMNTFYGDKINFFMLLDIDVADPGGQIAWLEQTLSNARKAGERVVIIGHIPCLTNAEVQYDYCAKYTPVIANYSDVIVAMIFGHTHTDQFTTIPVNASGPWNGSAAAVYFVSSAVTTYTMLNPGFRVYEFDPVSMQIVNWYQFITNLTEANAAGPDVLPTWSLEYSAKETYGLADFTAASFQALATDTFVHNQEVFQQYYNYFHTLSYTNPCTGACQVDMICNTQSSSAERKAQCVAALGPMLL